MKKIVSSILIVTLLLCVTTVQEPAYAYTAHSQSEAVAWIRAQEGKTLDYDNAYGGQCVDLIFYYYAYLGVSSPGGNAKDFAWNALPSGWQRITYYSGLVPQPGDIFINTNDGGGYGHVGLVLSGNAATFQTMEQNLNYIQRCQTSQRNCSYIQYIIRPDFTAAPAQNPWIEVDAPSVLNETNIQLEARVRNPGGVYIPTIGCTIWDYSGKVIKEHTESMNAGYVRDDNVHIWFNANSELGVTLQKGTVYQYEIYIWAGSDRFSSGKKEFVTSGNYQVTLQPCGGSCNSKTIKTIRGKTYSSLPRPTREGYVFDGWYSTSSDERAITEQTVFTGSGDEVLHAHWTAVQTGVQGLRGDMDGDGKITVTDALAVLRMAVGL